MSPTGAIFPQNRARWTTKMPSTGRAGPLNHINTFVSPLFTPVSLRSVTDPRYRHADRARYCMEACKTLQRSHYFKCLTH